MGMAAILWCDHLHLLRIYSPQLKDSPYEIWAVSEKTMFKYIDESPIWDGKSQPWPLKLIYIHCLLTYQVRTMTLVNSIKKTFQKMSSLNALGSKFDLDV